MQESQELFLGLAGSPQSGGLHHIMCSTRREYHTAVKKAKREDANTKAEELLTTAEIGDSALMNELTNTFDNKGKVR